MRGDIRGRWASNFLPAVLVMAVLLLGGCAGGAAEGSGETAAASAAPENLLNIGTPVMAPTPEAVGESAMASELPGAPVRSAAQGDEEGSVRGIMFDVASGRATYLVADAGTPQSPELFLLPPEVLMVTRIAPEKEIGEGTTGMDFAGIEFTLSEDRLAQGAFTQPPEDLPILAPEALDIWRQSGTLPEDWDAAARRYWAAQLLDARMSGTDAGVGPVFYVGNYSRVDAQAAQGIDRAAMFDSPRWKVHNENGEEIGRVRELFFNPQGSAVFAVLDLPDFRGQGNISVIVPWKRLVWSQDGQVFTVTASMEMLAGAPVFDPEALPDISVPGWEEEWQAYWEEDRAAASQPPTPATPIGQTLASRLIGTRLDDATGAEIGSVADFVVGPDGNILYLVLRMEDQLRPVPWMTFDYAEDQLIYIDDTTRLKEAPGYTSIDAIDPSQEGWDAQIRSYWGLGR